MSLEKLFTALILGLSWERILCCPFIALSLSLSDRWAGLRFILGRLAGICLLGSIISLVGVPFRISPVILDSAFGLFLIFLGINTFLKTGHKSGQKQFSRAGFGLGIFRGSLNPGRKIIYLLPLLWGVGVLEGLAISLAYALSSSVYLLIGFFSAELLNKIVSHQKAIKFFGGIILVILGIFYFIKALQAKG